MRATKIVCGLVLAGLACSATASADEFTGFYAGVGAGSVAIDDDFGGFDASDTAFKVFAGYSLNELIAVELAYIDGGTAEETETLPGSPFDVFASDITVKTAIETRIIDLALIGTLPLTESWSLFGRLGYASIKTDARVRFDFGPLVGTGAPAAFGISSNAFDISVNDTSEEVSYGAGVAYSIGSSLQLRAEYQGFDVAGSALSFISLSGIYRFR